MFSQFFKQDNATAKLSSWLILAASILSYLCHSLHLSPSLNTVLLVLAGVFTIVAQFFQSNPVIKKTSWLLLAYAVVDYLATNQAAFPNAKEMLIALAGVLKLLTAFSAQTPGDATPPAADPLRS